MSNLVMNNLPKSGFLHYLYSLLLLTSFIIADNTFSSDFISSNRIFTRNAYKYLSKEAKGENMFFSPFSVTVAMSMVYLGARGQTADQMEPALNIQNMKGAIHSENEKYLGLVLAGNANFTLNIANRLYPSNKSKLVQSFIDLCLKHYHADVKALDFHQSENARQEINQWIYERTAKKIKETIPVRGISPDTVMVLINAIYFKGNWAKQFDKRSTRQHIFKNIEGKDKVVDMMFKSATFPYVYDASLRCKVLELPYSGDSLSMVVVLPDTIEDFGNIEKTIFTDQFNTLLKSLDPVEVDVSIPKFKLESDFDLCTMFRSMGIQDLFVETADLSGIDEHAMMYVSKIIHKTYVDVNEEGTEAAAVTVVSMVSFSFTISPTFTADHPFLFFIRDKRSGIILFIGRVVDFDGPVTQNDEL